MLNASSPVSLNLRARVATTSRNLVDSSPVPISSASQGSICRVCTSNLAPYACPYCFCPYCCSNCFRNHSVECMEKFSRARASKVISFEKDDKRIAKNVSNEKLEQDKLFIADRMYQRGLDSHHSGHEIEREEDYLHENSKIEDMKNFDKAQEAEISEKPVRIPIQIVGDDDSESEGEEDIEAATDADNETNIIVEKLLSCNFNVESLSMDEKKLLEKHMRGSQRKTVSSMKVQNVWWRGGSHTWLGGNNSDNKVIFQGISEARRVETFISSLFSQLFDVSSFSFPFTQTKAIIRFQILSLLCAYVVTVTIFPSIHVLSNDIDSDGNYPPLELSTEDKALAQKRLQAIIHLSGLNPDFKPQTVSQVIEVLNQNIATAPFISNYRDSSMKNSLIPKVLDDVSFILMKPELFLFFLFDCWNIFVSGSRSEIELKQDNVETISAPFTKLASDFVAYVPVFQSRIKLKGGSHTVEFKVEQLTRKIFFFLIILLDEYRFMERPWRGSSALQEQLFEDTLEYMKSCEMI